LIELHLFCPGGSVISQKIVMLHVLSTSMGFGRQRVMISTEDWHLHPLSQILLVSKRILLVIQMHVVA
jgi:hypothetical protein